MVVHDDYTSQNRPGLPDFSHVMLRRMGMPGDEATVNNTKDVLIQGLIKDCGLVLCSF